MLAENDIQDIQGIQDMQNVHADPTATAVAPILPAPVPPEIELSEAQPEARTTPARQDLTQIFRQEFETVERFRSVLEHSSNEDGLLSYEGLMEEYTTLGKRYEVLLKQAGKLMRIGDVAQRRLMNVQKELERQNQILEEQSVTIELANGELQEKNIRLKTTLSEIGFLNDILDDERRKAQDLLLNILPQPIAFRLQSGEELIADKFDKVTVLFADIVGFTELSARVSATMIVKILNELFSRFDGLLDNHKVEKIKTIGDCYMLASGIPIAHPQHAAICAAMALDMQQTLLDYVAETGHPISMRIGLHCGPVVAGVIGVKKFIYDLWGDTVNTASRMESHGTAGKIHCSEAVFLELFDTHVFEPRGEIEVKGKGSMKTYFLLGERH
jgi:class 3 adenylate cyclase